MMRAYTSAFTTASVCPGAATANVQPGAVTATVESGAVTMEQGAATATVTATVAPHAVDVKNHFGGLTVAAVAALAMTVVSLAMILVFLNSPAGHDSLLLLRSGLGELTTLPWPGVTGSVVIVALAATAREVRCVIVKQQEDLQSLAPVVEQQRQALAQLAGVQSALPRGVIVAFHGGAPTPNGGWTIPEGWAVCDGSHGTPDLRKKFIFGAETGYASLEVGGSCEHKHDVDVHLRLDVGGNTVAWDKGRLDNYRIPEDAVALRQLDGMQLAQQTTTSSESSLPPFCKLLFIMKT